MKITTRRLKGIIKKEMQRLHESRSKLSEGSHDPLRDGITGPSPTREDLLQMIMSKLQNLDQGSLSVVYKYIKAMEPNLQKRRKS